MEVVPHAKSCPSVFVDNADLPKLDLRPYLPGSAHGAILITSRNRESVDYAPDGAVAVDGLEEEKPKSKLDNFGFLELAAGTDPIVE